MNCESVQRLIYEAVDRALAPNERRLVDTHLVGCERCRSEMAVLDALIDTVETTPPAAPSDTFLANVMAGLPASRRSSWFVPPVVFPRVVFAATLAVAALLWLYRGVFAEFLENLAPVQAVTGPVTAAIGGFQAYVRTQVGAVAGSLPEPVSTSVDWGSLLLVVTTLVVGFILVRTAEALGVGNPNMQVGKRS